MFYELQSSWAFVCTYQEIIFFFAALLINCVFKIWSLILAGHIDIFLLEDQGIYSQCELFSHLKSVL